MAHKQYHQLQIKRATTSRKEHPVSFMGVTRLPKTPYPRTNGARVSRAWGQASVANCLKGYVFKMAAA